MLSPRGDALLANGFTGALHLWRAPHDADGDGAKTPGTTATPLAALRPAPALSGHWGAVVDACWHRGCLFTASTDQTLRVTARGGGADSAWRELARPQVHGHDFSAVVVIPQTDAPERFVYASASEEKVVRIFEAPGAFACALATLRGETPPANGGVAAARVPALGLSNKAVAAETSAAGESSAIPIEAVVRI